MSTSLISTGSLAKLLGVTAQTIREWAREGIIKSAYTTPHGHARWDKAETAAQLEEAGVLVPSHNDEQGFTLIELLVVILIIGILLAIAAPAFLGQQDKAHDSKAKQQLAVAYKTAASEATSNDPQGNYPSEATLRSKITQGEPEITVAAGTDPAEDELAVVASTGNDLDLSYLSKSGHLCTATVVNGGKPDITCDGGGGGGGGGGPAPTYVAAVTGDSPAAYYRLGDPDASFAADETGGNDASYGGGSCTFEAAGIPGGDGNAAISSSGDCFLAINPVPVLTSSFSVEYWYKSSFSFTQGLFSLEGPDGDNLWSSTANCGGNPCIKVRAAAISGGYIEATMDSTNDGSWHQIVSTFTYNSGVTTARMYRDGALQFTEASGVELRTNSTSGELGRSPLSQGGGDFNLWGDVDELSLYDFVLSDAEVLNHYNLGSGS